MSKYDNLMHVICPLCTCTCTVSHVDQEYNLLWEKENKDACYFCSFGLMWIYTFSYFIEFILICTVFTFIALFETTIHF